MSGHIPQAALAAPSKWVAEIAFIVAHKHGFTAEELRKSARGRAKPDLARARHEAMYYARAITGHSYPVIGATLGCDHSTVMYGIRKHEERMRANGRT
jgi:chromosomal replication initiation ATPase DnaA